MESSREILHTKVPEKYYILLFYKFLGATLVKRECGGSHHLLWDKGSNQGKKSIMKVLSESFKKVMGEKGL